MLGTGCERSAKQAGSRRRARRAAGRGARSASHAPSRRRRSRTHTPPPRAARPAQPQSSAAPQTRPLRACGSSRGPPPPSAPWRPRQHAASRRRPGAPPPRLRPTLPGPARSRHRRRLSERRHAPQSPTRRRCWQTRSWTRPRSSRPCRCKHCLTCCAQTQHGGQRRGRAPEACRGDGSQWRAMLTPAPHNTGMASTAARTASRQSAELLARRRRRLRRPRSCCLAPTL